jgi:SAM-dependent methyltransferase
MNRALPEIARVLRPGGVLAGLWNVDDDRVGWVAGLAEMSKRKSSITLTTWRGSAAKSRQEQLLGEASDLFSAAEVSEFGHGQVRTADSLLATIGTHSHLLVMEEAERARLLARVGDFLRSQPETAHGEFTLPMVTVGLRARRR